ncbi:hypothetical protein ES708_12544 [subsurface metagenome]
MDTSQIIKYFAFIEKLPRGREIIFMYNLKNIFTIKGRIIFISIVVIVFLCGCNIVYDTIPSVAENFIGEWTAINPARISKVKIHSSGNKIVIHEWTEGDEEHPEDYDWGEQVVEISDFSDGTLQLNWTTYSEWSCIQKIEILANGVLKVFSTENYYDTDIDYTYTDYFYNPDDENSYIPSLPGVGLYQDNPEFVNVVNAVDSPKEIVKYMEDNFNYKILWGPHSPYQTYLSKEGDCAGHAVFASAIANFYGYECFFVLMCWTDVVICVM